MGSCWAILGPCWAYVGPSWAYVGPSWSLVGPKLGHLGAHLGPSWAILGLILGHLGAMLAQGGTPPNFFSRFMLFLSRRKKHRKLRGFSVAEHRSAVGAIAKASGLRPGALPIDRACRYTLAAPAADPPRTNHRPANATVIYGGSCV